MANMTLPRMRTIQATANMIKEMDPDTSITRHRLRVWVLDGTIPHVNAGNKRLINVDLILDMLASGELTPTYPEPQLGVIRRIS